MGSRPARWMWLLLSGVLVACAATPAGGPEEREAPEQTAVTWEEACGAEGSLLALCEAEQCGLYRCQEVAEHLTAGQVVRTLSTGTGLVSPGGTAQRYWGSRQSVPGKAQPVLVIPWGARPQQPLLPSQKLLLEGQKAQRSKPYEMHHIFPQETGLKEWFLDKGINIHEYTMPLEIEEHRRIHRGAKGGPWNEAWRQYQRQNFGVPKEELFRHAGRLIYEFQLYGILVPYRQLMRTPPIRGQ